VQAKLDANQQTAARNTGHQYLLHALISCGACRLTCGVRQTAPGYRYYQCRGRTDPVRAAQGQRCTATSPPGSWTSWSGPAGAPWWPTPPRSHAR
jgi:site-specific DNA recombinase